VKKNLKFVNQFNQIGISRLTIKRSSETKKEEKMRSKIKSTLIVIVALFAVCAVAGPAMAAINNAVDGGGGGITLGASGNVTITSTALGLVKAVYDTAGNCLASSDSDALCGGTNSINVPTGTRLTFVIYVDNTAAVQASDVRFRDDIDDVSADYFEFQTATYGASQGIMWGTRASAAADKNNIYTAATTGTAQTNALDGSTQVNEYAGIDTTTSPDELYVGGDASSPDNDQVDIAATTVFAVSFDVIKRD